MCGVQPAIDKERPKYVLALETRELTPTQRDTLARDLDCRFRSMNPRYDMKRGFGDLHQLEVAAVGIGTFVRYRQRLVQRGMPAGQLKDKTLPKDGGKVLAELLELSRLSEPCS
jgi:hypothetical protein